MNPNPEFPFQLGEPAGTEHEFVTQRARELPRDLFVGPAPDLQSRRASGVQGVASQALMNSLVEPWRSLLFGIQRKADFIPIVGVVGIEPVLVRPMEERTYLIIQNTSVANVLLVGVGYRPATTAFGVTGLILAANGGNYEPAVIPQGDIWLVGNAANTQFVLYVAQG